MRACTFVRAGEYVTEEEEKEIAFWNLMNAWEHV